MATHFHSRAVVVSILLILVSCQSSAPDTKLALGSLNLRRGEVISCGPTDQKLGTVVFPIQGTEKEQELFNLGMKLLHSFEYMRTIYFINY